ncbi:aspartate kinase, partial [Clostridium sp. HCS.1]
LLDILAKEKISLDLINIIPTEQIFTIDSNRKEKLQQVLNKVNILCSFTDNCSTIAMVVTGM